MGGAQRHEMLRDRCLPLVENGLDMTDAHFVVAEHFQNVQPRRVGEGPKQFGSSME